MSPASTGSVVPIALILQLGGDAHLVSRPLLGRAQERSSPGHELIERHAAVQHHEDLGGRLQLPVRLDAREGKALTAAGGRPAPVNPGSALGGGMGRHRRGTHRRAPVTVTRRGSSGRRRRWWTAGSSVHRAWVAVGAMAARYIVTGTGTCNRVRATGCRSGCRRGNPLGVRASAGSPGAGTALAGHDCRSSDLPPRRWCLGRLAQQYGRRGR